MVLAGAHSVAVGFDEEPGEYRWSIIRTDNGTVLVNILSFSDLWSNQADADGTMLLSASCTPLEFGKAVREAAEAVLKKHGLPGYKERWCYDFPSQELELLRSYVAARERDRWGRTTRLWLSISGSHLAAAIPVATPSELRAI